MENEDHTLSGHLIVPFNKKIQDIFFRTTTKSKYSLYKDNVELERTTRLSKAFIDKYLIPRGFELKKQKRTVHIPMDKVNGVSIGVTRITKGKKTVELLISIHAKSMRTMIKRCDAVAEYVTDTTGIEIKDPDAVLWTRQEEC